MSWSHIIFFKYTDKEYLCFFHTTNLRPVHTDLNLTESNRVLLQLVRTRRMSKNGKTTSDKPDAGLHATATTRPGSDGRHLRPCKARSDHKQFRASYLAATIREGLKSLELFLCSRC